MRSYNWSFKKHSNWKTISSPKWEYNKDQEASPDSGNSSSQGCWGISISVAGTTPLLISLTRSCWAVLEACWFLAVVTTHYYSTRVHVTHFCPLRLKLFKFRWISRRSFSCSLSLVCHSRSVPIIHWYRTFTNMQIKLFLQHWDSFLDDCILRSCIHAAIWLYSTTA